MKRIAALVLVLCAGCASSDSHSLMEDTWFGEFRELFSDDTHPPSLYGPNYYTVDYKSTAATAPKPNP
jgi:hypothetical protein